MICAIIIFAMRSKHIAALITFFATFAFSAFIALLFATPKFYEVPPVKDYTFKSYHNGCRKGTGDKIKDFLVQDKQNGSNLDRYRLSYDEGFVTRASLEIFADSVSEYYALSTIMHSSHFPRDFQNAWSEHMGAWMEYEEFLQTSKNKRLTFEDFNSRAERYSDEITRTWKEVLRVGREHGADLPANF